MKHSKFKIILLGITTSMVLFYACSKNFLEKNPLGSLDQNTLANKAGVEGVLIGAYSLLDGYGGAGGGWQSAGSNWVYGGVASDDAYKGSDPGDQADIVPIETYS
ncbi:MAG: RagB/SusD family nutrient uptake outer membrane protein, partial [Bacteroidota bacterium]